MAPADPYEAVTFALSTISLVLVILMRVINIARIEADNRHCHHNRNEIEERLRVLENDTTDPD